MRPTMLNYILYVLIQTIIIENAMPSGADFRVAGMYLKGILLYGVLLVGLLILSDNTRKYSKTVEKIYFPRSLTIASVTCLASP